MSTDCSSLCTCCIVYDLSIIIIKYCFFVTCKTNDRELHQYSASSSLERSGLCVCTHGLLQLVPQVSIPCSCIIPSISPFLLFPTCLTPECRSSISHPSSKISSWLKPWRLVCSTECLMHIPDWSLGSHYRVQMNMCREKLQTLSTLPNLRTSWEILARQKPHSNYYLNASMVLIILDCNGFVHCKSHIVL